MKININNLLAVLRVSSNNTNIPHPSPKVNSVNKDTDAFVVPKSCACPLHVDKSSLQIDYNENTGQVKFHCTNSMCLFKGDAIALLAQSKKVSTSEVLQNLRPGGIWSHVLEEPLRESEIIAYLESKDAQERVSVYLSKCQQALRQTPEKCSLRPGLSQSSVKLLPPDIGLFIPDCAPPVFNEFCKAKYKKSRLVLYPYTYNDEITHISVFDAENPVFEHKITLVRPDLGVFLGSNDVPRKIILTHEPISAALMYGNCRAGSMRTPPVMAVSGYPLPDSCNHVTHIRLVTFSDRILPLENALAALTAPEIIVGSNIQPDIKVWATARSFADVRYEDICKCIEGTTKLYDLADWCLKTMDDLLSKGKTDEIYQALKRFPIPEYVKPTLVNKIQQENLNKELISIISAQNNYSSNVYTLGNGRSLKNTGTELLIVGKRGGFDVVCNVGITVNHKIRTYDDNEILVCTITPQDRDMPSVKVNFPENTWKKPEKLQKIVSKAFLARNFNPYIAFYDQKGYNWRDILSKLAERCPIHQEVEKLGLDDISDLHMPEFVIRTSQNRIETQNQIFTLPDCVLKAYSGISGNLELNAKTVFRNLLNKCDNLYVAAFTCGLMHILYQMTFAFNKVSQSTNQPNRHLFFVETESGIWSNIFKQLATLFSGIEFVPSLNYANPKESLEEYSALGTLPLITYIPGLKDKLAKTLDDTTVDVIGLVDTSTAMMTVGRLSAAYITPSEESSIQYTKLDSDTLEGIRNAFASFVLLFLNEANFTPHFRTASIPAVAAYKECCRILEIEESALVEQIVKPYFAGAGMSGVNLFFDMIKYGVLLDEPGKRGKICVVNSPPQADYSFTKRGQHIFMLDNCVILSKALVELVNKNCYNKFTIDQLDQELKERDLLISIPENLDIDSSRCWCVSCDTWATQIIKTIQM